MNGDDRLRFPFPNTPGSAPSWLRAYERRGAALDAAVQTTFAGPVQPASAGKADAGPGSRQAPLPPQPDHERKS